MYSVKFYDYDSLSTRTLDNLGVDFSLKYDPESVKKRMLITANEKVSDEMINIAYQVLKFYPKATQIQVLAPVSPAQTIKAVAMFLAFVFAGPILLCLEMFGFPKGRSLFRKILDIPQFKKFRLVYLVITFTLYVGIIVLFILSICLYSMKDMIAPSLYILAGYDIVIFVLAYFLGNNIYKKYYVAPPVDNVSDFSFEVSTESSSMNEEAKASREKKPSHALLGFEYGTYIFGLVLSIFMLISWAIFPYMERGRHEYFNYYEVLSGEIGPTPTMMFVAFVVGVVGLVIGFVMLFVKKYPVIRIVSSFISFVAYILALLFYLIWVYDSGILHEASMTIAGDIIFDIADGILIAVGLAAFIIGLVATLKNRKKEIK